MAEAHPGDRFGLVGPHGELILDASSARLLNEIRSEIKRLSNLTGVPPVNVAEDGSGRRISLDVTPPIEAKLSGSGAPYSFVEQSWTGSAWADKPDGRSGMNAYECNAVTGLSGKVVRLRKTLVDDWRFQFVKLGAAPPPPPCGIICLAVTSNCSSRPLDYTTATLTIALGGTTIATGPPVGEIGSVGMTANGSGYTSVPTWTIAPPPSGVTATATATLGTTSIASVTLTGGGSNYTVPPTATIGGTVHGSGAVLATKLGPSAIATLTLTNGGSGYTNGTGYALSFNNTGTGGTGAAGTFDVAGNVVTAGGSGYTSQPLVSFPGAAGSGATATTGLTPGPVATLTRNGGGGGYVLGDSPTVVFSGGGGGSGATATATLGTFTVVGGVVTNKGSGYLANPSTTITGGGGSGAVGFATFRAELCTPITSAGTYTLTAAAPGFQTATQSLVLGSCANSNPTISLTPTTNRFQVQTKGCCTSFGMGGAIVTITSAGPGDTETTDVATGFATTAYLPVGALYTFSATHPRYTDTPTTTATLATCTVGGIQGVALTFSAVAASYVCVTYNATSGGASCCYPTARALNLTDGVYGAQVLTYTATMPTFGGAGWYGTKTVSFGGCSAPGCTAGAAGVKLEYGFDGSRILVAWSGLNTGGCPCGSGTAGCTNAKTNTAFAAVVTCPPSFLATATYSHTNVDLYCADILLSITE
jgi:hypothetical protein